MTTGARILADGAGPDLVAADVVLGVGWGGTATKTIKAGSNDSRGAFTVTASATTPAQATATIKVTFKRAYDEVPTVIASRGDVVVGTAVDTVFPQVDSVTKTDFTLISNTLPVAGETTVFAYVVVG